MANSPKDRKEVSSCSYLYWNYNYGLNKGGTMLSIVKSMALQGLEGYLIDVQVDVSSRTSILGSSSDFQTQV